MPFSLLIIIINANPWSLLYVYIWQSSVAICHCGAHHSQSRPASCLLTSTSMPIKCIRTNKSTQFVLDMFYVYLLPISEFLVLNCVELFPYNDKLQHMVAKHFMPLSLRPCNGEVIQLHPYPTCRYSCQDTVKCGEFSVPTSHLAVSLELHSQLMVSSIGYRQHYTSSGVSGHW